MTAIDILAGLILAGLMIAQFWRVREANKEYMEALDEVRRLEACR